MPRCPWPGPPARRRRARRRGAARRAPSRTRAAPRARPGAGPRSADASSRGGEGHWRRPADPPGPGRTRRYQRTPDTATATTRTPSEHPERTATVRRRQGPEGGPRPRRRRREARGELDRIRLDRTRGSRPPGVTAPGAPRPSAAAVRARQAPQTPLARSSASSSFPPQAAQGSGGAARGRGWRECRRALRGGSDSRRRRAGPLDGGRRPERRRRLPTGSGGLR